MTSILRQHTILYVEDEPAIRGHIAEYLQSYFGTVYTASDGKEGLVSYKHNRPDVAILDINLPKLDGLTLAHTIREHDATIKLVMLTAFTDKEKLLAATELKLTKYLVKPVPPKAFKQTMELLARELTENPSRFRALGEDYLWDNTLKQLTLRETPVHLTVKEHALLVLLMKQTASTVTYEEIMIACWEDAFERDISIDSVKNLVSQLRHKLPPDTIRSIYGKGYAIA